MDKLFWIWLMSMEKIGNGSRRKLLAHFKTPEAIYHADEKMLSEVKGFKQNTINNIITVLRDSKDLSLAKKASAYMERHDIVLITQDEAHFPQCLRDIDDAPVALFTKGDIALLNRPLKIGVVGSRKASPGSVVQSKKFSRLLAQNGITIVSGFAMGIDTAAHEGALHEIGSTICVLGCGINVCYPPQNRDLYQEVLSAGGLIITEYFMDVQPLPFHFRYRNRIISGLSQGVLVVEAAKKSGALITANHALEQGRNVYVIPQDISHMQSVGSNNLLKDGAKPVTDVRDILEDFVEIIPQQKIEEVDQESETIIPKPKRKSDKLSEKKIDSIAGPVIIEPKTERQDLEPEELKVIRCIKEGYSLLDQLVIQTGFDISRLNSIITMLELKDAVSVNFGKVTLL